MGFFPFFVEIKNKPCLIIGGGNVALRKITKLLPFEPEITVIAPEICSGIEMLDNIKICRRAFEESDLDGVFMAIAATDDTKLNQRIYELCCEKNIPVNTVDDPEKCGFIFPALVHKDEISIGISTSGSSPVFARYLREQIELLLDEKMLETARIMGENRPLIKASSESSAERKAVAEELLKKCLESADLPEYRCVEESDYEN
jgi:siroheme synthase-like protein